MAIPKEKNSLPGFGNVRQTYVYFLELDEFKKSIKSSIFITAVLMTN